MSAVEFTEEDLEIEVSPAALSQDVVRSIQPRDSARSLAERIARRHGIQLADIFKRNRSAHLVRARADLAKALRALGWSYPAIGAFLDRDHTTIIWLVKGRPRKNKELVLVKNV